MSRPTLAQRIPDRNIWIVYAATLLLGVAYGVSVALIALHLDALGFGKTKIGGLATFFALGIVVMSIPAGWLIRKISAKATLAIALAGYACAVAVFPLLTAVPAIAGVRFLDGAFSVCIWVSCETILLQRASHGNKAFVTSLYAIAVAIGYIVGPLTANVIVAAVSMRAGFFASGIIAIASCVFVLLRLERDTPQSEAEKVHASGAPSSAMAILKRIKTSCFGTFAYGYFQAAVVLYLPIYLMASKGITQGQTIIIPAFFAAGMLLFSNVAGRLSDRVGHLLVMRVLTVVGMTMVASFVFLPSFALMALAVFIAGATLASISPVSLALQGVVTEPKDYSRANSIYNQFYALGILLGPPVSGWIFDRWGGPAMLMHLAALWLAFIVFSAIFYADDPAALRRPSTANDSPEPLAPLDG